MSEALLFELSVPGRTAASLPELDVPASETLPASLLRTNLDLPEVSEIDLVRHFVRLSQANFAVDIGMYPLGSCTMKYNPKVNEDAARLAGFTEVHPNLPDEQVQGSLLLMYALQQYLAAITGFDAVSLQPAAGAQGELCGVLMIRAYHHSRGDIHRTKILIPDTAHGTNPASTVMAGLEMVEVKSDDRGNVDLDDLRSKLDENLAGMMLTNPNTLGLFDEHICEITRLVHSAGGLMYGDGANLNALMGITKPAALGFDVMHLNLHKTFSTPHGGGGPGSGPVAVRADLAQFLPGPIVAAQESPPDVLNEATASSGSDDLTGSPRCRRNLICRLEMPEHSIGRIKAFYGNFGVLVRAYTYIRMLGEEGLRATSEAAVLAANYLQARLKTMLPLPYDRLCMHECVFEGRIEGAEGVRALDISKRMMDYGIHPPTNYFPMVVPEALMIEPTETESKQSLDEFIRIVQQIVMEAREHPELLHEAPHHTPVRRLNEVQAARDLRLRWQPESHNT